MILQSENERTGVILDSLSDNDKGLTKCRIEDTERDPRNRVTPDGAVGSRQVEGDVVLTGISI